MSVPQIITNGIKKGIEAIPKKTVKEVIKKETEKLESSIERKGAEALAAYNKGAILSKTKAATEKVKKAAAEYVDDGIHGYDFGGKSLREDIRTRLLSSTGLCDDIYEVAPITVKNPETESKFAGAVKKLTSIFTKQNQPLFENMLTTADGRGIRCKTPLSGRNEKAIRFKLHKLKEQDIKTIIDLRSAGECSKPARKAMDALEVKYLNFPVEDGVWDKKSLEKISEFIKAVNEGNYCMGCANGESRTDLATAINYIINPETNSLPDLYFGSKSSSRVSIKSNLLNILKLTEENPDIVTEWGYKDYADFHKIAEEKLTKLINSIN